MSEVIMTEDKLFEAVNAQLGAKIDAIIDAQENMNSNEVGSIEYIAAELARGEARAALEKAMVKHFPSELRAYEKDGQKVAVTCNNIYDRVVGDCDAPEAKEADQPEEGSELESRNKMTMEQFLVSLQGRLGNEIQAIKEAKGSVAVGEAKKNFREAMFTHYSFELRAHAEEGQGRRDVFNEIYEGIVDGHKVVEVDEETLSLLTRVYGRLGTQIEAIRNAQGGINRTDAGTDERGLADNAFEKAMEVFKAALCDRYSDTMKSLTKDGQGAMDVCDKICAQIVGGYNAPEADGVGPQAVEHGKAPVQVAAQQPG